MRYRPSYSSFLYFIIVDDSLSTNYDATPPSTSSFFRRSTQNLVHNPSSIPHHHQYFSKTKSINFHWHFLFALCSSCSCRRRRSGYLLCILCIDRSSSIPSSSSSSSSFPLFSPPPPVSIISRQCLTLCNIQSRYASTPGQKRSSLNHSLIPWFSANCSCICESALIEASDFRQLNQSFILSLYITNFSSFCCWKNCVLVSLSISISPIEVLSGVLFIIPPRRKRDDSDGVRPSRRSVPSSRL